MALGRAFISVRVAFFAEDRHGTRKRLCRVHDKRHSAKTSLPTLFFADYALPSATLGKAFAECFVAFAKCLPH
jgi:hypothetical protein